MNSVLFIEDIVYALWHFYFLYLWHFYFVYLWHFFFFYLLTFLLLSSFVEASFGQFINERNFLFIEFLVFLKEQDCLWVNLWDNLHFVFLLSWVSLLFSTTAEIFEKAERPNRFVWILA